jgi:hypothetical protein
MVTKRGAKPLPECNNASGGGSLSSSPFPYASRVEKTLRLASRRRLLVEVAEQSAWAFGTVLSGFIVMLLFGTAGLGWLWIALLSAAGLIVAAFRLRKRLLSRYRVAQVLDRKLSLSDALSTAYFLLSKPSADNDGAARFQLEQADRVAATIRVEDAFPFKAKRAWAICGALAAFSFGLFALRYLVTQSLSLRPALIALQMPPVIERLEESLRPKQDHVKTPPLPRYYPARPATADSTEAKNNPSLPTEASEPAGASDRNGDLTKAQTRTAGKGDQQVPNTKQEARTGDGKSSQGESSDQTQERSSPQGKAQKATPGKEQSANGQNTSPGLMNRMKDALSNMMAKMRANGAPQGNGQQRSEQQQSEAKNDQSASASNATPKPGEQSNGENSRDQESSDTGEGQAQGQTSERPQNSQGHSSDQSAQKGSDAQSGVGRQDGDKEIKNAEQLKAMGKLAEIIGKRSANLTGDMTVETPSGKQQLSTAYSQQVGRHTDSGGEIHHNEIPMMYQQYVREYMEQVRKQQEKARP